MWAIGVITYFLLCGYTPFDRQNSMDEVHAILNAEFVFGPVEYWGSVSETGTNNVKFRTALTKRNTTYLPLSLPDIFMVTHIAKDFVSKLLTADPNQRMTAVEALQHSWLAQDQQSQQQELPTSSDATGDMEGVVQHDLLPNMVARMRARTRFRNAINAVSAINRMRGGHADLRHIQQEEVSHVLHRGDDEMDTM
jgi:serine/threonine protein kinase